MKREQYQDKINYFVSIREENAVRKPVKSHINGLCNLLTQKQFLFLRSDQLTEMLPTEVVKDKWHKGLFIDSWNHLGLDMYMGDGGVYRKRRHAYFTLDTQTEKFEFERMKQVPHYQGLNFNSLNGGIARYFEPILEQVVQNPWFEAALDFSASTVNAIRPDQKWNVEAHQFRVEALGDEEGHPTPEGVHQDGVDYVFCFLINRQNVVNGTSAVYDTKKQLLASYTMQNFMDLAMMVDQEVFHGVSPIGKKNAKLNAYRDMLVITFKNQCQTLLE